MKTIKHVALAVALSATLVGTAQAHPFFGVGIVGGPVFPVALGAQAVPPLPVYAHAANDAPAAADRCAAHHVCRTGGREPCVDHGPRHRRHAHARAVMHAHGFCTLCRNAVDRVRCALAASREQA